MEKRYRALNIISIVCKVLAWISLVGGILAGLAVIVLSILGTGMMVRSSQYRDLAMMTGGGILAGITSGIGLFIGAVITFVLFYAQSDFIQLFIGIEQNTRECAYYLRGNSGGYPTPGM